MKKIFIDTNVLLDLVLDRAGAESAAMILEICRQDPWMHAYTSYLSMANIAYVIRKRPMDDVRNCLSGLSKVCGILPMNDSQMLCALRDCQSPDFEDSLQIMCAEEKECSAIVTNNTDHFARYTDIPVFSPAELLEEIEK